MGWCRCGHYNASSYHRQLYYSLEYNRGMHHKKIQSSPHNTAPPLTASPPIPPQIFKSQISFFLVFKYMIPFTAVFPISPFFRQSREQRYWVDSILISHLKCPGMWFHLDSFKQSAFLLRSLAKPFFLSGSHWSSHCKEWQLGLDHHSHCTADYSSNTADSLCTVQTSQ